MVKPIERIPSYEDLMTIVKNLSDIQMSVDFAQTFTCKLAKYLNVPEEDFQKLTLSTGTEILNKKKIENRIEQSKWN